MGYILGNHTWDHPDMTGPSAAGQAEEIDRKSAEQVRLVGARPCAFRPPYGYPDYNATTLSLAQQRRMKVWSWSVDTEDWNTEGSGSSYWVNRIIRLPSRKEGCSSTRWCSCTTRLRRPGHRARTASHHQLLPPPRLHLGRDLTGRTGVGYQVLTSNGGVHNYGAPFYGSARGTLPAGVTTAGLASDPVTGGYWLLRSDGGVAQYNAPWYGSPRNEGLTGLTVKAIASSQGGYLILTSNGGVHNYGAPFLRLSPGHPAPRSDGSRASGQSRHGRVLDPQNPMEGWPSTTPPGTGQ